MEQINESNTYQFSDLFDAEVAFTLEEASDVDGEHVIGKMSGTFFVPDGKSRNKRFYPKSLWEKVLKDPSIKKQLADNRMLGTIGHNQPLDDDAILEGKASHVVTKLGIDGDKGVGEALILNTPAGRILKTMVGAKVKMFTSSRALGGFKGTFQGLPVVDEGRYKLKGFDFVLDPGFLEANPELVESLKESMDDLTSLQPVGEDKVSTKGEATVEKELLESFVKENNTLKSDLSETLTENEKLKAQLVERESQLEVLKDVSERAKKAEKSLDESNTQIEEYKKLGTPEEISTALEEGLAAIKAYKDLGTPEAITEAKEKLETLTKAYEDLGSPEEIGEALDKAKAVISEYKELGTVEEITAAFDRIEEEVAKTKEEQNEAKAEELAKDIGVSVDAVKKVYGKLEEAEIREMFKDVSESVKTKTRFQKKGDSTVSESKEEKERPYFKKSHGKRLMESFS